jgi:predicted transcriptional regulator
MGNEEGYYFSADDFTSHIYVLGGTGTGKTNLLLRMMLLLLGEEGQREFPCSVVFIDPAGDASLLFAETLKDWKNLAILDPLHVSFGFNPVGLYPPLKDKHEKALQMQTQVGELVALLQDLVKTDPSMAPRLHWIYRGTLFFLYNFGDNATFLDLYNFMTELSRRDREEVASIFRRADIAEEIFVRTMEAIAALEKNAYAPVLNRISNFVMPPDSLTARTFCARNTTLDMEGMLVPGRATVLRLDKSLPGDFREMVTGALVMKIWFLVQARARRLEQEGKGPSARTPVILFIDEFQNVQKLKMLTTMLSEGRKFGLSLCFAHQYLSQIETTGLVDAILANVGTVCALRCSPDDASKLSKVLGEKYKEELVLMPKYHIAVKRNSQSASGIQGAETWPIDQIPAPVHGQDEVINFMRTEMEKKYGGAVEDRVPIYQDLLEEMLVEKGRPIVDFVNAVILFYLYYFALPGSVYRPTFGYLRWFCEDKFRWKDHNILLRAALKLEDLGFLRSAATLDLVLATNPGTGVTEWREPVMSNMDEVDRAKSYRYELTPLAKEKFFARPTIVSPRAGGPIHLRVMDHYIAKYRKKFCWVTADYGERHSKLPDLVVFRPLELRAKEDAQEEGAKFDPYHWDYAGATAIEIETSPNKNQKQVKKNYDKCMDREFGKIIFAVITEDHKNDIERILADKDPTSFSVEVVKELGFSTEALKQAVEEEESVPSEGEAGTLPPSASTGSPPAESTQGTASVPSRGATAAEPKQEGAGPAAASQQPHSTAMGTEHGEPEDVVPTQGGAKRSKRDDRNEAAMRRVLYSVGVGGLSTRNEIAKECALGKRTTSRQLGKLVERGLLALAKRKYFITEKGKEAVEKLKKEVQAESKPEKNDPPPASS